MMLTEFVVLQLFLIHINAMKSQGMQFRHAGKMKFAFDCTNTYSNISLMYPTLLTKGTVVLTVRAMLKKGHRDSCISSGVDAS